MFDPGFKQVGLLPSAGSYTSAQGINVLRQDIAEFISRRDSHPATCKDIFLTNGGAEGIEVSQEISVSSAAVSFMK